MSVDHRRRLSPATSELALAGLALMRLHAQRDPDSASECVAKIRRILAKIDEDDSLEAPTNPILDVAAGYARWAQVYDLPGNPLVESEEPSIRPLLDEMKGDPLLDVACGTGRHLTYLAERGHRVIGVDLVPEMIEKARQKTPDADFRSGDLTRLPVEDAEVAGIVCSLALEHVADLGLAYSEFARVVASQGLVIVSTIHPILRSVFGWGAWFVDAGGKVDIPTHDHRISDHLNAAARAGLSLRHCEEPVATDSAMPSNASLATRIAYSEIPMVLVLAFEASEACSVRANVQLGAPC